MVFFKTYGLLGQNARNLKYIKGFNTKMARKLADSKLMTKDFLKSKGVPVPETLAIFKKHDEITQEKVEGLEPPFVIKPNNGFGGKGIIVVDKRDSGGNFIANTEHIYSPEELSDHLLNILDGFFSLSGSKDKVIIEKKIEINEDVDLLGKYGLPDIRIIVFNMVPVIAMLRVPTEESDGKANIHGGACAAGIDIGTGKLTYITQHSKIVKSVPGIGDIRGIIIPDWDKMLEMAVRVQKVTNIGYLGCDIVMDKRDGPLLLEMNIRPGLEVQIANMARLKDRLERVEGIFVNSVEKGVRLGRDLFSGDIEEKIRNLSGKKVLGAREYITILYNEKQYKYLTEIKPGRPTSMVDKDFLINVLKVDEEVLAKASIRLQVEILGRKRSLKFLIKDLGGTNLILGLNAMRGFMVDPFKYKKGQLPISDNAELKGTTNVAVKRNYENQLKKIDKQLVSYNRKLLILKNITPTNVAEEKAKFIESGGEHIPHFKYKKLSVDLDELLKEVSKIEIPDIPLSGIFKRKKEETIFKIKFLKAFSENNTKKQTKYSKKLFGDIEKEHLEYAHSLIENKEVIKSEEEYLSVNEIRAYVKKFNHIYGINIKLKVGNKTSRFVMNVDKLFFREGSKVGKKEMRSIIAHEIEGHYLRRVNGKKMEYSIFGSGTAHYLEIDEGIAIYNQNRFLNKADNKFYSIYSNYILIDYALNHSYEQLLDYVMEYHHHDLERVFNAIMRLKRGFARFSDEGVFTKDTVYVNGLKKVENFLANYGELKELYIGKISIEDLEELKESTFMKLNFNDTKIPFSL